MPTADLVILAAAAFATSALTAVLGVGGGVILLAVMALLFEPLTAIPLHGFVQLISNGSRTWVQRDHVRWPVLGRFVVLLAPMTVLGLGFARSIPVEAARLAIGAFVLLAVWAPRVLLLGMHPERAHPTRRFLWLGAVVGFANTTVGATGPLQAPFYQGLGLERRGVVGTFAATQATSHAVKVAVFAATGFAFATWIGPLVCLAAGVVAGTLVGSRLLERVDEARFRLLYRVALTLVALRLIVWNGLGLL